MMERNDITKRSDENVRHDGQLFLDSCSIIEQARSLAYRSVNETLVKRNWLPGHFPLIEWKI